jgi:hypothetical protein
MTKANSPHPLPDLVSKIGRITLHWNDLHLTIFSIFWRLNSDHAVRSSAIFFSVQADRTQRNMTAALVKLELESVPMLRDNTIGVLDEIGKLAGRRNDVMHAMWDFDTENAKVFAPSSMRLAKKRLGEELDSLYEELVRVSHLLMFLKKKIDEFWKLRNALQVLPSAHPEQPNAETANPPSHSPPNNPQDS